ncbi:MAG: hypothetical protein ACYDCL_23705 [Myxococcales bacterium]
MAIIATQAKSVRASSLEAELESMDAGVLKDIPATSTLTLNGSALTQAQIDTQIKTYLSTIEAADLAKAQYQTALVARRNQAIEARDFYLQLKRAVTAYFGTQSALLVDFGLKPAKARAVRTSAELALTAAKRKQTREARGTTSKKQKLAINPSVGTPAVMIDSSGTQVIPPTVADGQLPTGSAPEPSGSPSASSTPQGSAGRDATPKS